MKYPVQNKNSIIYNIYINKNDIRDIHTSVPTGPMLGLSPLDDGGHRHHRFLLLHHLGCLDLPVFTRHFYFFFSSPPPSSTLHRIRKILLSSETRTISLSRHLEKRKK